MIRDLDALCAGQGTCRETSGARVNRNATTRQPIFPRSRICLLANRSSPTATKSVLPAFKARRLYDAMPRRLRCPLQR